MLRLLVQFQLLNQMNVKVLSQTEFIQSLHWIVSSLHLSAMKSPCMGELRVLNFFRLFELLLVPRGHTTCTLLMKLAQHFIKIKQCFGHCPAVHGSDKFSTKKML